FFSFASIDWKKGKNDDLQKFFNDLEEKLRELGVDGRAFFAPDTIERGSEWEKELKKALPASAVLVPMYSPNYFKSVWCGKEWEVFWQRQQENESARPPDVTNPDVILPVIWGSAQFLKMPKRVEELQNQHAATDSKDYKENGLGYMMQSPRRFSTQYRDF